MQEDYKEVSEIFDTFGRTLLCAICTFVLLMLACALCGCTTTKYVPVETVRTEYVQADTTAIYNTILRLFESRKEKETKSDSLIDREKETVVLNEHGDTTRHDTERTIYRVKSREKELEVENKRLRDSISSLKVRLASVKTDSVPSIVPVERELSRWEKTKMDFGELMIGGSSAVIIGLIAWIVIIKRKL